ncbi:hypothetical protein Zm00014a_029468 [Zea mays]|uniref:Uncharacterized protein n=1 Tax=Zea mays TaxID=4577 RepID=A0A3L6FXP1_MAIZE|nr:hypothetical protein Zm00014a_029468 [Zea mays]
MELALALRFFFPAARPLICTQGFLPWRSGHQPLPPGGRVPSCISARPNSTSLFQPPSMDDSPHLKVALPWRLSLRLALARLHLLHHVLPASVLVGHTLCFPHCSQPRRHRRV